MYPKYALHASETHPFVDSIENLLSGRFTMRYRASFRVEATTTFLTQVGLGAISGLPIFDSTYTLTGRALWHLASKSRLYSHYRKVLGLTQFCVDQVKQL